MFGGFVDPQAKEPELAAEATGAFQALVNALAALQREGVVRGDDTVLMARFVWGVVHGVAMLGIDGQLREPGGVEELMRYAIERLATGIAAPESLERPVAKIICLARAFVPVAFRLKAEATRCAKLTPAGADHDDHPLEGRCGNDGAAAESSAVRADDPHGHWETQTHGPSVQ